MRNYIRIIRVRAHHPDLFAAEIDVAVVNTRDNNNGIAVLRCVDRIPQFRTTARNEYLLPLPEPHVDHLVRIHHHIKRPAHAQKYIIGVVPALDEVIRIGMHRQSDRLALEVNSAVRIHPAVNAGIVAVLYDIHRQVVLTNTLAVVITHIDHVHVVDAVDPRRICIHAENTRQIASRVDGVAVDRLTRRNVAQIIPVSEIRIILQVERIRIPEIVRIVPSGKYAVFLDINRRRDPRKQADRLHHGIDHLIRTRRLEHCAAGALGKRAQICNRQRGASDRDGEYGYRSRRSYRRVNNIVEYVVGKRLRIVWRSISHQNNRPGHPCPRTPRTNPLIIRVYKPRSAVRSQSLLQGRAVDRSHQSAVNRFLDVHSAAGLNHIQARNDLIDIPRERTAY